jgi:hypothetical protein
MTPALAAEQCVEVKQDPNIDPAMQPTYAKYADTLTCYLRVDGRVLRCARPRDVNGLCRVGISGDTGLWTMKDDLAEAYLRRELRAARTMPA